MQIGGRASNGVARNSGQHAFSVYCQYRDSKRTETLMNTKLYGVASHNTAVCIFSTMRISDLKMKVIMFLLSANSLVTKTDNGIWIW